MPAAVISPNADTILRRRYLAPNETIEGMFRRVANGNEDFYQLMVELRFLPNSPTLFNAGLNNGCTSSACFVFDCEDSMFGENSITETRNKATAVAKAGGGVGYYFGKLRPKGSPISSVHRKACGPIAVLKDYHGISRLITQGGKRELAQMGVLSVWHDDIREFIHVKDEDPQGLGSFNISVSWTDEWIRNAFQDRGPYLSAEEELWNEQCQSAWRTGCPGMFFPDTVNRANPNKHLGLINAPNPCGETPNRNNEPCNLGSLSLPRYWLKGQRGVKAIDLDRLAHDAQIATRFLDDILDRNVFPHPDITAAALLTRKLGLGAMGWADLLALCHIHYDTEEAVELGRDIMSIIGYNAERESVKMAGEKGPYEGFSEDKTDAPMARNETRTSIAPTGSIAIIADVWGSIEPHFALDCERTTSEGLKLKDGIAKWVAADLDGFIPKSADQIAPEWHVKHQAAFQANTDLGVSKTINLPKSATVEDVSRIYRLMYESGCKGGTVFRDGCRDEQVLVSKKTSSVYLMGNGQLASQPRQRKLPSRRPSETIKLKVAGVEIFLIVGFYPGTQELGEIFVEGNFGTTVAGLLNSFAINFSVALQNGTPLQELINHHKNKRFEPCGLTDNKDVPHCTSIPDLIVRILEKYFLKSDKTEQEKPVRSGIFCPDCGSEAILLANCLTCVTAGCGWSRC